ncbi:hypothetical protein SKAU_G00395030 [Synaphobranchus kaupii]|uniref:C2H2-type domain-containing protein n=1 Tax=Synaphobranchus kaupii TaxID=118154 RepID=A0A9Q1ECA4_SYNKA|nr:hypothetical protein SKAU_G00395030 [Synaphobranchus kaupii]
MTVLAAAQAIRCTLLNCTCECFQPGRISLRTCDHCKHGWVAHALDKLSTQHLHHPSQVEMVQSSVVFDISSLMLYGTQALPVRLKILLDRLFSVLKQEEVLHILHSLGWTLRDYVRGYILQDAVGKVLERWSIMSQEEEVVTLQQFLRFGETKSIVELMALQEQEGQVVTAPPAEVRSGIRTFIESSSPARGPARSPALLTCLQGGSPNSIHHFENLPNSLAFLLPFQYLNPGSTPTLGLPAYGLGQESGLSANGLGRQPSLSANGLARESSLSANGLAREPGLSAKGLGREPSLSANGLVQELGLPNQSDLAESKGSEASLSPCPSLGALGGRLNPKLEPGSTPHSSPTPPQLSDHYPQHHVPKARSLPYSSSLSCKAHRMRRMGAASRKGRVCCSSCGKTFYDKGTLKIHYNAVHLKIKHRCTVQGCNMVFSSLRSRNRHSANPNPRLHLPVLRNNRDRDLIRSAAHLAIPLIAGHAHMATPVISGHAHPATPISASCTHSATPVVSVHAHPAVPVISVHAHSATPIISGHAHMATPLLSPTAGLDPLLIPPFYRALVPRTALVHPPVSVPSYSSSQTDQSTPPTSHSPRLLTQEPATESAPKKKPRKSSMPVKIEKEAVSALDEYEEEEDPHSANDDHCSNDWDEPQRSPSPGGRSPGPGPPWAEENRAVSRGEHDLEREPEREPEAADSATCDRESSGFTEEEEEQEEVQGDLREETESKSRSSPSPLHPHVLVKEELSDSAVDVFCASGKSPVSAPEYSRGPPKPAPRAPGGYPNSGLHPRTCYVCKKSFRSSYSVKLHYRNVHLKEMHVCTLAACNAAFPSRRSRDRHSSNINLHRKLLTKELDHMALDSHHTPPPPIFGSHERGLGALGGLGGSNEEAQLDVSDGEDISQKAEGLGDTGRSESQGRRREAADWRLCDSSPLHHNHAPSPCNSSSHDSSPATPTPPPPQCCPVPLGATVRAFCAASAARPCACATTLVHLRKHAPPTCAIPARAQPQRPQPESRPA